MILHRHNVLTQFLATIRNRLWLQSIARLLYRGLWASTIILVTCGALHYFAVPLSMGLCAAIALLPPLIALGTGVLFRRPTRETAALAADRWFDGKALFTSAWELQTGGTPAATRSMDLVLQRAQRSAAQLQQRVSSEHPVTPRHSSGLPLALALIGIFLLLLPGAQTPDAPTPAGGLATWPGVSSDLLPDPVQTTDNDTAPAALSPVQRLRPATADNRVSNEHSAASAARQTALQGSTPRGDSRLASPDRAEHAVRDRANQTPAAVPVTQPPRVATGTLANAATGTGARDTTAGGEHARRQPQDRDTASPAMAFQAIEIARIAADSDTPGAAGNAGVELSSGATPPVDPAPRDSYPAVAERVSVPYRSEFSPAMKVYVSRYFHQFGTRP